MMKRIKIEILYFTVILVVLAIVQHSDLLHSPLQRVDLMTQRGNYLHPLLWAFPVYIVVGVIRVVVNSLLSRKKRKKESK